VKPIDVAQGITVLPKMLFVVVSSNNNDSSSYGNNDDVKQPKDPHGGIVREKISCESS